MQTPIASVEHFRDEGMVERQKHELEREEIRREQEEKAGGNETIDLS
jgi:hypothetical protein